MSSRIGSFAIGEHDSPGREERNLNSGCESLQFSKSRLLSIELKGARHSLLNEQLFKLKFNGLIETLTQYSSRRLGSEIGCMFLFYEKFQKKEDGDL